MQTARKSNLNGGLAPSLFDSAAGAAVLVFCLLLPASIDAAGGSFQWQSLMAQNFSSHIHLHPHILVFVTVPWCGESRSLMKELSDQLTDKQDKLASIELMVVFRNQEKVLAESLGAAEGLTILFYHHAVPYKYKGRLNARDILASSNYLMSLMSDVLPLIPLNTSDDLEKFLASTDKAVILLDPCGWAPKLLAQHNSNETARVTSTNGGDSARGFNVEAKQTIIFGGQKNAEALESEKLKCGIDTGFGGIPWFGEFSPYNEAFTSLETDLKLSAEPSCTLGDHQEFATFFSKFVAVARDMFLPPQRQRYGLVSNSSLLSSIGLEGFESFDKWSLIVYYAGCPNCSRVLKDESNLQVGLEMHNLPVMELVGTGMETDPALPSHEPSIVLFVDRSARSVDIRTRSEEALSAFREVGLHHKNSFQMNMPSADWPKKSQVQTYKGSTMLSGDSRIVLSSLSQKIRSKDKISVMIVNDGEHATLDNSGLAAEGRSLHEILAYLLGQKKQAKLSVLAKEAGFQLLSDDMDVNMTDDSLSHTESLSDSDSTKSSSEHVIESGEDPKTDMNLQSPSLEDRENQYNLSDGNLSNNRNEKAIQDLINTHSSDVNSQQLIEDDEPSVSVDAHSEKQTYLHDNQVVKQLHQSQGLAGSFFFSDGNYQLLRSLTGESEVPRMVIIDPISQMHFVSPERKDFSYLSISEYINEVFNRSLPPHQRSTSLQRPIVFPHPPFVNLDFHEKDPIPGLTTDIFTELVIGSSSLAAQNASNAWNKDVLVLFSNSWCGFCQRMHLVVREVHRSLKGYMGVTRGRSKSKKVVISNDSLKAVMLKLPTIYQIDCTLNDCSWILKSMDQRELYPSLLLFPAERKDALPYEGDVAVNDIINFIAKHGSSSFHLVQEKGNEKEFQSPVKDAPPMVNYRESSDAKDNPSVNPKDHSQGKQARYIQKLISFDAKAPEYNIVTGSFLIATDKLTGANPFTNSRILIVIADQHVGFQGLIVNKPINPESLAELGLPERLKDALIYYGGPVVHPKLPLVALTKKPLDGQPPEILPGVYFLDQVAMSHEIEKLKAGEGSAADYWFFLGYSGWGWHQLFDEIAEGAWNLDQGNSEHLEWP